MVITRKWKGFLNSIEERGETIAAPSVHVTSVGQSGRRATESYYRGKRGSDRGIENKIENELPNTNLASKD